MKTARKPHAKPIMRFTTMKKSITFCVFAAVLAVLLLRFPAPEVHATEASQNNVSVSTVEDLLGCDDWDLVSIEDWKSILNSHEAYELFVLAPRSDGFYATDIGIKFHQGFQEDPLVFTDHLLEQPEDIQDRVIEQTFCITHSRESELQEDQKRIQAILEDSTLTPGQQEMFRKYLDKIDQVFAMLEEARNPDPTDTPPTTIDMPPFDPDTVRGFIDSQLQLRNADEGFYQTMTKHFLSDPEAFLELISDLSSTDARFLAKGIAYTLHKQETAAPSLSDLPDGLSELQGIFRYEFDNPANHSIDALSDIYPTGPTTPSTEPDAPSQPDISTEVPDSRRNWLPFAGIILLVLILIPLLPWWRKK